MPITGLLLTCQPDQMEQIERVVDERPKSEVRATRAEQLIVVTDTVDLSEDRCEVEALGNIPGVVAVQVVYCNVEDLDPVELNPS